MAVKKIPMRTCVVTREKLPKRELLRIVRFNNIISVDPSGKQNGKGCYVKKDREVVEKMKSSKILEKVFECEIDDSIYEEILKNIDK